MSFTPKKKRPLKRSLPSHEESDICVEQAHSSATFDLETAVLEGSSSSRDSLDHASSDVELHGFDIDNQLEERLKKHGLNRRNVKTIIHELLSDEHVRGLLKANLHDEKSNADLPETKNLRSKRRRSTQNEKSKRFTEINLPEDDEEDDDEYHPEIEETTVDTEASQEALSSSVDLDTSVETNADQPANDSQKEERSADDIFLEDLTHCENELQALNEISMKKIREDEIIAQRTRSKHSLLDTAMAEIETAFNPPDVTEDMYMPSGDDDWHKWLAELMLDDTVLKEPDIAEDDHEQDPDYNFIQSESEEPNEREDYRTDCATHIPKKEVQELLQLRHVPTLDFKGQSLTSSPAQDKNSSVCFERNIRLPIEKSKLTVKKQLCMLRQKKMLCGSEYLKHQQKIEISNQSTQDSLLRFTQKQLNMLDTQMRQHVQLLTQVNLLCRNIGNLSTIVHDTHALLKEIQQLSDHDRASLCIPSSHFDVPNLSNALSIAKLTIEVSDPITRLTKVERSRGLSPLPGNIANIIATNQLFAFSRLIPSSSPQRNVNEHSRLTFTAAEDNLLLLGLNQMEGHLLPWYVLVHRYVMPSKQPDQIRTRFTNSSLRSGPPNVIRTYRQTGKLPAAPSLHKADIGPGTSVKTLLELENSALPAWLIALQHEAGMNVDEKEQNNYKVNLPQPNYTGIPTFPQLQQSYQEVLHQPTCAMISPQKTISIVLPTIISAPTHQLIHVAPIQCGKTKIMKRQLTPAKSRQTKKLINSIRKTFSSAEVKKNNKKTAKSNNKDEKSHKVVTLISEKHENRTVESEASHFNSPSISSQPDKEIEKFHQKKNGDESSKCEDEMITDEDFDGDNQEEQLIEEISDEDLSEVNKQWQIKKHKMHRMKESSKVKWKNKSETSSKKLGGRLHRLHPGLTGKKKSRSSEDHLSQSLRRSAENVKLLEEDTIVQLDPSRVEKEMLFAQGYLKRIEETLKDHPDILTKVLEIMCEFDLDSTQSPPELFDKLSKIISPWPDLVQGFAPFLMPGQAHICGLLPEQQVYARARKFLRQLEIRFHDNPHHLSKILTTFRSVAESGIYNEQDMKASILSLLKSDPYLQEEFLIFFDDERPPESRLHGDYENVIWNDDMVKNSQSDNFEHVHIPSTEGPEQTTNLNENHQEAPQQTPTNIQQEIVNNHTDDEDIDERGNTTSTWDDVRGSDNEDETSSTLETSRLLPHDVGLISEDALSCSPFKRHMPPGSSDHTRPITPTESISQTDIRFSSNTTSSSSQGSNLPATPTGSKSSDDFRHFTLIRGSNCTNLIDESNEKPWTRDDDAMLLSTCKQLGPTSDAFAKIACSMQRDSQEISNRLHHLMALISGGDATSPCSDSETDTEDFED